MTSGCYLCIIKMFEKRVIFYVIINTSGAIVSESSCNLPHIQFIWILVNNIHVYGGKIFPGTFAITCVIDMETFKTAPASVVAMETTEPNHSQFRTKHSVIVNSWKDCAQKVHSCLISIFFVPDRPLISVRRISGVTLCWKLTTEHTARAWKDLDFHRPWFVMLLKDQCF